MDTQELFQQAMQHRAAVLRKELWDSFCRVITITTFAETRPDYTGPRVSFTEVINVWKMRSAPQLEKFLEGVVDSAQFQDVLNDFIAEVIALRDSLK